MKKLWIAGLVLTVWVALAPSAAAQVSSPWLNYYNPYYSGYGYYGGYGYQPMPRWLKTVISAGAGAGIGAVTGGRKGAGIGALILGAVGYSSGDDYPYGKQQRTRVIYVPNQRSISPQYPGAVYTGGRVTTMIPTRFVFFNGTDYLVSVEVNGVRIGDLLPFESSQQTLEYVADLARTEIIGIAHEPWDMPVAGGGSKLSYKRKPLAFEKKNVETGIEVRFVLPPSDPESNDK